jgi:hypothetical protein
LRHKDPHRRQRWQPSASRELNVAGNEIDLLRQIARERLRRARGLEAQADVGLEPSHYLAMAARQRLEATRPFCGTTDDREGMLTGLLEGDYFGELAPRSELRRVTAARANHQRARPRRCAACH